MPKPLPLATCIDRENVTVASITRDDAGRLRVTVARPLTPAEALVLARHLEAMAGMGGGR